MNQFFESVTMAALFGGVAYFLSAVSLLGLLLFVFRSMRQLRACHRDRQFLAIKGDPQGGPLCSLLIPVRNEARNIGSCLDHIRQSTYKNLEILVVDDASTDDTLDIVLNFQRTYPHVPIRVVRVPTDESREQWVSGKSYVLWQGAQEAKGRFLLFVDADVRLLPASIAKAIEYATTNGLKALSCSGVYKNPSFWGDVLESFIYLPVFHLIPFTRIHDPDQRVAWMNGQFILFEQKAYFRLGGHEAIGQFAFDDMSLAALTKSYRIPYAFLPMAQAFDCVNYVGWREAYQGWVRLLAGGTPWLFKNRGYFGSAIVDVALVFLWPFLALLSAALHPTVGATEVWGVSFLSFSAVHVGCIVALDLMNRLTAKLPPWRCFFIAIGALSTLFVFFAAYRSRFGGKGFAFRQRSYFADDVERLADLILQREKKDACSNL